MKRTFAMSAAIIGLCTTVAFASGKYMMQDTATKFTPTLSYNLPPSGKVTIRGVVTQIQMNDNRFVVSDAAGSIPVLAEDIGQLQKGDIVSVRGIVSTGMRDTIVVARDITLERDSTGGAVVEPGYINK